MDENEIIKKLDQIARMLQELPQVMAATYLVMKQEVQEANFEGKKARDLYEISQEQQTNRKKKVWYQCNPARNPKCPKRTCKYNPELACLPEVRRCDRTSDPEAARRDEKGNPIIYRS